MLQQQITERAAIGKTGEELVVAFLVRDGFEILERNYRKFYGEIDIIARKKDVIVFVEVRSRVKVFDDGWQILPSKQKKIMMVAHVFLAKKQFVNKSFRFDVAFVHGAGAQREITYVPNAFEPNTSS